MSIQEYVHDVYLLVEQVSADPASAAMVRQWLAAALAFCWMGVCEMLCVCVLWAAPPCRLPRAAGQLNPGLELPMCPELSRSVLLKLNRVLKILCAFIIAFPALFLFLGTRALENGFQIYL